VDEVCCALATEADRLAAGSEVDADVELAPVYDTELEPLCEEPVDDGLLAAAGVLNAVDRFVVLG
jgi:hypothetical protein